MADNELITKADIKAIIRSGVATETYSDQDYVCKLIDDLVPVDAAPVIHGRWIKMTGMMPPEYHGHYACSECGWHMHGLRNSWTHEEELPYCPNCAAKMDGGDE